MTRNNFCSLVWGQCEPHTKREMSYSWKEDDTWSYAHSLDQSFSSCFDNRSEKDDFLVVS